MNPKAGVRADLSCVGSLQNIWRHFIKRVCFRLHEKILKQIEKTNLETAFQSLQDRSIWDLLSSIYRQELIIPSEMEVAPHPQKRLFRNTRDTEKILKQGIIERQTSGEPWPSRLRRSGCNIVLAKLVWHRCNLDAVWI